MTQPTPGIYGGVDTHCDVHVAAVVDQTGRILDVCSFPVSSAGYRRLVRWMRGHGDPVRVGWREPAATASAWPAISPARKSRSWR